MFESHNAVWFAARCVVHYALRFTRGQGPVDRFPRGYAGFRRLAVSDISTRLGDLQ
jgi:hypothetical protein